MTTTLDIELETFVAGFHPIVRDLTRRQKRMLITMHRYLDGDAFGSAVGLGLILRRLGIESSLLCVPFVPEKFDFLSRMSHLAIIEASENKRLYSRDNGTQPLRGHFPDRANEYGCLAVLDCAGFGQIPQEAWSVGLSFPHKINIDHHIGNTLDSDERGILSLVGDCSSTSEVLFHLMERLGVPPDAEIAVPLYVGVNADLRKNDIWEGNPAYPTQVLETLRHHVEEMGDDTFRQIDSIFSLDPWEQYLLDTIKDSVRLSGSVVYASFDPKMVLAAKRETDSLDNPRMPFHEFHVRLRQLMRQFRDTHQIVVLFDQMLGKVSLFDLHQNHALNLAGIGRKLGGGGHTNRAGFTFAAATEKLLQNGKISVDTPDAGIMDSIVEFIRSQLPSSSESHSRAHAPSPGGHAT